MSITKFNKSWQRSLIALVLVIVFPLNVVAQPIDLLPFPEPVSEHITISGEWEVVYSDRYLGGVSGNATISEDEQSATVTYIHPVTNKEYTLTSTSIIRDEDKVTITLEGESPRFTLQDGLNYPHEPVIIKETSQKLQVEYGESTKSLLIGPRKPSDLDKVILEMKSFGHDAIAGRWYYYADDVTYSDTKGFGRHFDIIEEDDGRIINQGMESWKRKKLQVYGVFTLESQLNYDRGIIGFEYPFGRQPSSVGKTRYLFIFGKNLPKKFIDPVDITHDEDEHIYYGNPSKMEGIERNVLTRDMYARGFKKLLESLPESAHEQAKKHDALIIRADLKDGVVPGYHTFTLNGVETGWLLQFGDNRASLIFSRALRHPTGTPDYERTGDLFLPEVVHLEVITDVELPVDEIPITVGIDGKIVNLNNGPKIIAKRTGLQGMDVELARLKEEFRLETNQGEEIDLRNRIQFLEAKISAAKRTYRTKALTLKKGTPTNQSSNFTLLVQPKSKVTAVIAKPGLISVDPPVASATLWTHPGEVRVTTKDPNTVGRPTSIIDISSLPVMAPTNARWRDYLETAYACDKERKDIDWNTVSYEEAEDINNYIVSTLDILSTKITMGDHAAMIYLRQTLMGLLEKRYEEYSRIRDEDALMAFRRYIEPYVWNSNYVIGGIMVQDRDGSPISFLNTFLVDGGNTGHKLRDKAHRQWIQIATKNALKQYAQELKKAYDHAKSVNICKEEDMLELTGAAFDNVSRVASSRLMRLQDDPALPQEWIPHYSARGFIKRVPLKAERVRLHEDLSVADMAPIALMGAIVSVPLIAWGGTAGLVAAMAIDIIDISSTAAVHLSAAYARDVEVEFATAAADVLGEQRKILADSRDAGWFKALGEIFMVSAVIFPFSVGDVLRVYKVYRTPVVLKQISRGRKLASKVAPDEFNKLKSKQQHDLVAFLVDAKSKQRAGSVLDDLEESVLKSIDDEIEEALSGPDWASRIDAETMAKIEPYLHRADVRRLMETFPEFVQGALRGADGDKIMDLIRYAPHHTKEQLEAAIDAMRKRVKDPQGEAFYKQAVELIEQLKAHGWNFSATRTGSNTYDLSFTGPNGRSGSMTRSFDEATGTLEMTSIFRRGAQTWIKEGLTQPLVAGKGMPTILFGNMHLMQMLGLGYAGKGGKVMKHIKIEHIVNPRSAIQLEWARQTYLAGKSFEEAVADGSLNQYARHCFSVQYAESAITMAGYRITGVRIELDSFFHSMGKGNAVGGMETVYKGSEPFADMIKRYGLSETEEAHTWYNIIIDVEPI